MKLTPAGEQVERALAAGYDGAAFNLYLDAIRQGVALAEATDESDAEEWAVAHWHRDTQRWIKWDEAEVSDGSILKIETYQRDEDGVVVPGDIEVEYIPNEDVGEGE